MKIMKKDSPQADPFAGMKRSGYKHFRFNSLHHKVLNLFAILLILSMTINVFPDVFNGAHHSMIFSTGYIGVLMMWLSVLR